MERFAFIVILVVSSAIASPVDVSHQKQFLSVSTLAVLVFNDIVQKWDSKKIKHLVFQL